MKNRPSQDEYFLTLAREASRRSNCLSRQVGCILTDERNIVLATGYNGVPAGFPHCDEGSCPRLGAPSGTDLHKCLALHAEWNALMFCADVFRIKRAYITTSPCLQCCVMLMNTSCEEIIFSEIYDEKVLKIWADTGRRWTHSYTDVSGRIIMDSTKGSSKLSLCIEDWVRYRRS